MLKPVVMAGGVGSRLWPVSRALLPKQFIQFPSLSETLFQGTLSRLEGIGGLLDPIVVCNKEHRFLVAEQLRQLNKSKSGILLEPIGRNTAPAIAMAAFHALNEEDDPVLLVLPADHLIKDQSSLTETLVSAIEVAESGKLVTFGIVPNAPETGFGYIELGDALEFAKASSVSRFVEKPNEEKATEYVRSGKFLWNSGMFMFKASVYLDELEKFAPDIFECCKEASQAIEASYEFHSIPEDKFSQCRSESIDYAVMEKTNSAVVIPLDANWSDLGSWDAIWETQERDSAGNAVSGDVLLSEVKDTFIQAQSKLVAAVGIADTVIVETADSVLVANRNKLQNIKEIVAQLELKNRTEAKSHSKGLRPWGSYETLAIEEGYQVKHIIVSPGAAISLQLHHHRSEHWTVIKGMGLITIGEQQKSLKKNESAFIPVGEKHRLENPSDELLEIIEVQVGEYLGEDDIVRFDDVYGRL